MTFVYLDLTATLSLPPWPAPGATGHRGGPSGDPVSMIPVIARAGASAKVVVGVAAAPPRLPLAPSPSGYADVGPVVRAENNSGYRQHAAMIRFSWHATSVKERIAEIEDRDARRSARAAYRFLMESEESDYSKFVKQHKEFLNENPRPDKEARKLWLNFIETPGLECAWKPWLFWRRGLCRTYVRASGTRRARRRASHATASPSSR